MAQNVEHPTPRTLNLTKPVPWPGSAARGAISWVCKFAFVDRKASASDALRETCSQTLELRDPLIDPPRPFAREARPVLPRGNAIGGKFGEFRADLLKRQPDPLREHDKGDPAQHGPGITAMLRARAHGRDQPSFLVIPQGRRRDAAAPRNFADGEHGIHARIRAQISLDFKFTSTCRLGAESRSTHRCQLI